MSEPTPQASVPRTADLASESAPAEGVDAAPAEPDVDAAPGPAPRSQAPVQVRLRRAPRYRVFVLAGALVGLVVAVVVSLRLGPDGSFFSFRTLTLYLATIGALLGGLVGGAVAVLVDRPRR